MSVLSDLVLPSKINCTWTKSGMDSLEHCLNKRHFKNFPYDVSYVYNNRGFRDNEWSNNLESLQNSIWCLGDSFTVGIGSPLEHTWPYLLQSRKGTRTINVSMDGASNQWISRQFEYIHNELSVKMYVICWSFLHRREADINLFYDEEVQKFLKLYSIVKDNSWPNICCLEEFNNLDQRIREEVILKHENNVADHTEYKLTFQNFKTYCLDESRRLFQNNTSELEDLDNFEQCVRRVVKCGAENVIHAVVPGFCPGNSIDTALNIFDKYQCKFIGYLNNLDYARDGFHFDKKHSTEMVDRILHLW